VHTYFIPGMKLGEPEPAVNFAPAPSGVKGAVEGNERARKEVPCRFLWRAAQSVFLAKFWSSGRTFALLKVTDKISASLVRSASSSRICIDHQFNPIVKSHLRSAVEPALSMFTVIQN
jgi:hypothetical protein